METKILEPGFLSRKIVKAALYEVPFVVAGAFFIVFGADQLKVAGMALIILAGVATGVFVLRSLSRIECPRCMRICPRSGAGEFRCDACSIIWKSGDISSKYNI